MFVGGNIVTWKSKKQMVVACSSTEAEYRAMAPSIALWPPLLVKLCGCIFYFKNWDVSLQLHLQSCFVIIKLQLTLLQIWSFMREPKHIEVNCHFVREKVQDKTIETLYIRSEDQLSDVFTKALSKGVLQIVVDKLTSNEVFAPT